MRVVKDPETRRQEIIDGAAKLFEIQGISKTSMSSIASDLNIAKGLLYYYFDSKESLVETVIDQLTGKFNQVLSRIASRPGLDFQDKLKMVLRFYFRIFARNPRLLSLDLAHPDLFNLLRDRLSQTAYRQVRSILQSGLDRGDLAIDYPNLVLRILIKGLADLYLEGVRDIAVHATLAEQVLGLKKGSLH